MLQNFEIMDREGQRMQATLFKDDIPKWAHILRVGACYEISQGVIKASGTSFTKSLNKHCYIFDKYSQIEEVDSDDELPGSILSAAKELDKITWLGLE